MAPSLLRRHPLLRFLAINLILGILVAGLAVGGLIALDIHGLRRLLMQDQSPILAIVLLAGGFIVTFGSIVMGSAVMALGSKPPGGGAAAGAEVDVRPVLANAPARDPR